VKSKPYNPVARVTLIISVALYLAALTQECYCTSMACGDHWAGFFVLAMGAIGGIMSLAGLTWYANPLLWIAWSQLHKNPKKALAFSLAATVVASGFLLFKEITDITPGRTAYITAYRLGYWLWLASAVTTTIGSLLVYLTWRKFAVKLGQLLILKVDFNARCNGGILLNTRGAIYKQGKKKIKLINGAKAIIWDDDLTNGRPDSLAVEALVLYSQLENSWIASFNYDDLKHESEREQPLLDN
jgi:hypothetical protein